MKTKYIISSLLSFTLLVGCAYSKSFSFTAKEPQWSFYGEGVGSYVTNMGKDKEQTSLYLSTDFGESETAYYTWKDLSPGTYKVITYVRAEGVQKGAEGTSFWHFYDGGFGTQSPFTDLYGDYDWRKIEYTINVKASELTIWFRLKAPGQVWVDDFFIEKVEGGSNKVSIEPAAPLTFDKKLVGKSNKAPARKKLYIFDGGESGHPFLVKNKAGEFSPQKFFNFKVGSMPVKDWSPYDRIEMDVFNPNDTYTDFFLTLADDKTTDYWSQVNHKSTLAPGWNKLNFSLTQYVGERGSHRYQRPINLSKLEKIFVVIDPDSKNEYASKSFLIDNIYLTSNPMPAIPDGVMAFDFTSQKAEKNTNLAMVTTQTSYNDQRGYGFVEPKFWRVEDSQYASEAYRYSIGILRGHFKVKVPNGKYQISLNIDKLGYWDVPFWADRTVSVNGTPIFKESRSSGKDFLSDVLRFEDVVPTLDDHPYDLYLSKIFHAIDKTIDVTNGTLDFEFEGDETGVSLNSLILWNKNKENEGVAYKKAFEKRNRDEFDWMSHSIQKKDKATNTKLSVAIVEPDLYLNPLSLRKPLSSNLQFLGGEGDTPYQVVQLNPGANDLKVSWSFSDSPGVKDIEIEKIIFQYTSPDSNHETYMLSGKYLSKMEDHSVLLKKNRTEYLLLKMKINNKTPKGVFKGEMVVHNGNETIKLPIEVTVLNYALPKIDFPVGFFGLDPLPFSYFKGSDYEALRKKYRMLALNELGEAGFTTFTGLPADPEELNELFKESSKYGIQTVYSYGGQFPQELIKEGKTSELKSMLSKKDWPKIVHTFSDEAGGYSDRVTSDIELGQKLKKQFPFMALGGFGSFHGGESNKLNAFFDYGFYSSLSKGDVNRLRGQGQRWGLYNGSQGNMDDPRFSFGLGLYVARLNGLSQYLEWQSLNNYPYYDLDGRESDVVNFYPNKSGKLLHSMRFLLASEGLHVYKKLKLIENAIIQNSGNSQALKAAKSWLASLPREHYFFSSSNFLGDKSVDFRAFEKEMNEHLKALFLK